MTPSPAVPPPAVPPPAVPPPDRGQSTPARWAGGALVVALAALLAWLGSPAALVVVGVLAFVLFMHELGHFAAARLTGMRATEFFLGFGPRLWSVRRGDTEYGLKAIPAGAYVRIVGMTSAEDVEPADEPRAYRAKSFPRRVLVASAGSLMHFAMAAVALVALHAVVGSPEPAAVEWEVDRAPPAFADGAGAPASAAGIVAGDRVLSVDGRPTGEWDDFVDTVRARPGSAVSLEVLRDGVVGTAGVVIATDPATGEGRIGIAARAAVDYETTGPVVALGRAVADFGEGVWLSLRGLWLIFSNVGELVDRVISPPNDPSANENLETRPVSLVGLVQIGSDDSFAAGDRLRLFAVFNIFIGVFNLLPLLPLDGGHLAIAGYERWRERGGRRRYLVDATRLLPLTYAVVVVLAFLGLGTLYLDIANPLSF
ncbi:MAG TPA: hypothetical protein DEP69_05490 [Acidimicrobiaceae bacterium]|nr:hypothetical protein [Acidimicrobiaceae bacterium]